MTDTIEQKALALLNECGWGGAHLKRTWNPRYEALCRAIEQHEAFRQEVSDGLAAYQSAASNQQRENIWDALTRFIIVMPDPLVDAWQMAFPGTHIEDARDECATISAAIEKRGGKIVWGEG